MSSFDQTLAEEVVAHGVIRLDSQSLPKVGDSLPWASCVHEGLAEPKANRGVLRIEGLDLFEFPDPIFGHLAHPFF